MAMFLRIVALVSLAMATIGGNEFIASFNTANLVALGLFSWFLASMVKQ